MTSSSRDTDRDWVSGDANPPSNDELLRDCVAAGLAAVNGWPGRGDKFAHSAFVMLAGYAERVKVKYEEQRKPEPIHIDNIDSVNAATWLAKHDEELTARVKADEEVRVTQDLMIEFFERFKATGSTSTVLTRRWWEEQIVAAVARRAERGWKPGDACGSCGSTRTTFDDDGVPTCLSCHATDSDE
jgi:hypothetical protein